MPTEPLSLVASDTIPTSVVLNSLVRLTIPSFPLPPSPKYVVSSFCFIKANGLRSSTATLLLSPIIFCNIAYLSSTILALLNILAFS